MGGEHALGREGKKEMQSEREVKMEKKKEYGGGE